MLSGSDIEIVVKDVVVKQSGCVVPLSIKVTLMDPTKFELPIAQACGSGSRPCVSDDRTISLAGTACKTFCSALKAIASEPLFSGTIDIAAQFSTETKDGFLVGDTSKKCEAPPGALSGNSTNGTQLSAGSVNVLNHGVAFAAVSTLVMALFA